MMTVRADKFTPEVLLSAPRRSAGVPNPEGTLILYTVSTYSFEHHKKTLEVRLLDAGTNESKLIIEGETVSEPNWLDGDDILLLQSDDSGVTHIIVGNVNDFSKHYAAGTIEGPASNVKLKKLKNGTFAVAVAAKASPDGKMYNPEKAEKPHSSGMHYKSLFVRHWDKYVSPERNAIWYGTLFKDASNDTDEKDSTRYKLSALTNALKGTGLESPMPPFGGLDHFDLCSRGLIFVARDPDLNPALNTKCNIYLIPLSSFTESSPPKPHELKNPGFNGAATSPVYSPDGSKAAFLQMRQNGYEADKNRSFAISDIWNTSEIEHDLSAEDEKGKWDVSPQSISFSHDGSSLLMTGEHQGRTLLYSYSLSDANENGLPRRLTDRGSVSDVRPLSNGKVFVSASSLVDNSYYHILDPTSQSPGPVLSSSRSGSKFGLSDSQVSEIWFAGSEHATADPYDVHAWVIKPSSFSPEKKYPLAYLIHGGPQSAWTDSWSTRWNPAVFAEQGYVVIAPNPTGSTGYGQSFVDGIRNQWGGRPYDDLVSGFEWIAQNLSYVDTSRAVALGASYGGYMMNWIQGHALGRKFKALVCHDGVFSMAGQLASEELYFPFTDLGGPFWEKENKKEWEKWDPMLFTEHWATPQLIIHNELDYRLTMAEGLAAFNVLQSKGVESEFLTFPDENHWVLKPENSLVWHTVVLNFVNRFVGLPPYKAQVEEE